MNAWDNFIALLKRIRLDYDTAILQAQDKYASDFDQAQQQYEQDRAKENDTRT